MLSLVWWEAANQAGDRRYAPIFAKLGNANNVQCRNIRCLLNSLQDVFDDLRIDILEIHMITMSGEFEPSRFVMPGLVPGIYVLKYSEKEDVDGRVKPGHDDLCR